MGKQYQAELENSHETSIASMQDPVEMALSLWNKAFLKAHLEFMAEKLKERMEQAWGPMADKAADAVIESMNKHWQVTLLQSGADKELREKLAQIFSEGEQV